MVMVQSSLDKTFQLQYIVYIDCYIDTFKCMSIEYLKYSYRVTFSTQLKHLGDYLFNSRPEYYFQNLGNLP